MVDKPKNKPKSHKEILAHKKERELSDIRFVSKTPEGRRFIWGILESHEVFRENGILDQMESNRFEGRRNAGINFLNKIMEAKPSLLGQLQEEHASELKREEIEIEQNEKESDPLSLD